MNPGDLVQIRQGLLGGGDVGMIVGPSKLAEGARGYFDVLFSDGVHPIHPTSMRKMHKQRARSNKEVDNEAR